MSPFLASFLERITFLSLGVVKILKLMGMWSNLLIELISLIKVVNLQDQELMRRRMVQEHYRIVVIKKVIDLDLD